LAGRFCQIWLQPKYENKLNKYPLYFWLPTLNKVKEIWKFFFQNLVEFWLLEKSQKAHGFSILNLLYSFLTVYIPAKERLVLVINNSQKSTQMAH
jgi:hypothetical protein